jgi:hypothetical protein
VAVSVIDAPGSCLLPESGGIKVSFVQIDLGVYSTGGVSIRPEDVGLFDIYMVFLIDPIEPHVKTAVYNRSARKILAFSDAFTTQVEDETDLSGEYINSMVIGY